MLVRVLAVIVYRYLSVRLSVTRRYYVKTAKCRIMHTVPHDSPGTLVSWCQISCWYLNGMTPMKVPNTPRVGKICIFQLVDKTQTPHCLTFVFICHDAAPYQPERAGRASSPEGPFSLLEKGFKHNMLLRLMWSVALPALPFVLKILKFLKFFCGP